MLFILRPQLSFPRRRESSSTSNSTKHNYCFNLFFCQSRTHNCAVFSLELDSRLRGNDSDCQAHFVSVHLVPQKATPRLFVFFNLLVVRRTKVLSSLLKAYKNSKILWRSSGKICKPSVLRNNLSLEIALNKSK